MRDKIRNEQETLDNIFKAIDKEPEKITSKVLFKQRIINLLSNRVFEIIIRTIPFLVLAVLLFHIFTTVSSKNAKFEIASHHVEGNALYITVTGAKIDPDTSYMVSDDGLVTIRPDVDKKTNTAVFEFDGAQYNVYLCSKDGREIHILVSGNTP